MAVLCAIPTSSPPIWGANNGACSTIRDLVVPLRRIEALRGVSLSVDEGKVGDAAWRQRPGKSTTLRAISGLAKPAAGDILFDGKSIAGLWAGSDCPASASLTCRRAGGCSQA